MKNWVDSILVIVNSAAMNTIMQIFFDTDIISFLSIIILQSMPLSFLSLLIRKYKNNHHVPGQHSQANNLIYQLGAIGKVEEVMKSFLEHTHTLRNYAG